jgi:AcrR family transcriptional regulator
MMAMPVPYEKTGRTAQKSRTRQALVEATRALLRDGQTPNVEDAAQHAGISRTTAYRYFPNQRSLLLAAHPQISPDTLLPNDAPDDVELRLDAVMAAFTRYNFE